MPKLPSPSTSPESDAWDVFPPPPPGMEDWVPDPDCVPQPYALPPAPSRRQIYHPTRKGTNEAERREERKIDSVRANTAANLKSSLPKLASVSSNAFSNDTAFVSADLSPMRKGQMSAGAKAELLPKWAAPLEKLLAEENVESTSSPRRSGGILLPLPVQQSALEATTEQTKIMHSLIPPHRRKSRMQAVQGSHLSLDPAAQIYQPKLTGSPKPGITPFQSVVGGGGAKEKPSTDQGFASKPAPSGSGTATESWLQVSLPNKAGKKQTLTNHTLTMDQTISAREQSSDHSPVQTPDATPCSFSLPATKHGHWMKMKLVAMLEDELDLGSRATRRELMAMSHDEMDQHLHNTMSAHARWWQANQ